VATRFDKLAIRYKATLQIAAINDRLQPAFPTGAGRQFGAEPRSMVT